MTQVTETIYDSDDNTQLCLETEFANRPALKLSLSLPLETDAAPIAPMEATPKSAGLRALLSRWFSKESRDRLRKLAPWLVSGSILGLNLVIHAPTFVVGAMIAGLTIRILKAIIHSNPICEKAWQWLLKKANLSEKQIPWMTAGFAGGAWLSAAMPSNAAFFVQAETYLRQILSVGQASGVNTLVPLLFGTLRVIFIIYIGIALVRVVNSFRNDEDWVTAARIPLIVVLCVVIGDSLSTLIVQGAGGA